MDVEATGMMSIPTYTSIVAGVQRRRPTDLDRYARAEFGDRESGWLADGVHTNHSDPETCQSDNDGRLLRRLTRAIASFF